MTDTFVIAFWIHEFASSSREKHDKKGKERRLKNLAELIPELIPVRLFLTRGFVFIIFRLELEKLKIYLFFFTSLHFINIPLYVSALWIFIRYGKEERKKKKKEKEKPVRIKQNSG